MGVQSIGKDRGFQWCNGDITQREMRVCLWGVWGRRWGSWWVWGERLVHSRWHALHQLHHTCLTRQLGTVCVRERELKWQFNWEIITISPVCDLWPVWRLGCGRSLAAARGWYGSVVPPNPDRGEKKSCVSLSQSAHCLSVYTTHHIQSTLEQHNS